MKTNEYKKHFVCLCALFVLGNGIITLPALNATRYTFLGFLVSFGITLLLLFLSFLISKATLWLGGLLAVFVIGDTFIDFIKFISQTLLKESPKFLIILPFLLVIILFCFKNIKAVLKFSLIAAFFSVLAILFFFIFTVKDFQIENVIIKSLPSFEHLYVQTIPYVKKIALPCFLLGVYANHFGFPKSTLVLGVTLGNGIFAFCILNSILLFGSKFAGLLEYPYAIAISTVTFGNLFTRMDGFSYFIYFASCLIKITTCVEIIKATVRTVAFI